MRFSVYLDLGLWAYIAQGAICRTQKYDSKVKCVMPVRWLRKQAREALAKEATVDLNKKDGEFALRNYLSFLFASGTLSAELLSKLAWLITQAGGKGVDDLATPQDIKGRNVARMIQGKLGAKFVGDFMLLKISVPICISDTKKKAQVNGIYVLPIYEVIGRTFRAKMETYMQHAFDPDLLCANFYGHETVQMYGASKCFPLRIFIDFAKLYNKETTLNIFISCLHDTERIPFGSFKKRLFCKCGCRGAHTFQVIMDCLAWMCRVCAEGRWPAKNYYGKPWAEGSWRKDMAGKDLFCGNHGVVCEIALDLDILLNLWQLEIEEGM